MKRLDIGLIVLVYTVVAIASVVTAFTETGTDYIVSVAALLLVGVSPYWLGSLQFDFIDKVVDRYRLPGVNLRLGWHIFFATLGTIPIVVFWPKLAMVVIESEFLRVGHWLEYWRAINSAPGALGYPSYAWTAAIIAGILFFLGYVAEPFQLRLARSIAHSRHQVK